MEEQTFDPREIILILRRWAWLLVLGLLLGAGIGFFVSTRMKPVYLATTKVLVTRSGQSQSSDITAYLSDLQLAQTYLQLLTTETVFDITSTRTGVNIEPEDELVKAQVIRDTQVIKIEVENTDPQQAALIANSLVQVLIEQNELIQSGRYDSMEESLRAQKTQIEAEIQNLQDQIEEASTQSREEQKLWMESKISALEKEEADIQQEILELGTINTAEERLLLDQKNTRLEEIHALLSLYQENYNNLLLIYGSPEQNANNTPNSQLALLLSTRTLYQQFYATVLEDLETVRLARMQNTPNVVQIEKASPPDEPIRPHLWLNVILGGLAGALLAIVAVVLHEVLDDTLKTPEAVENLLGVPVIGFVAKMKPRKKDSKQVHVACQPHSPVSESFRSLRTCLEIASVQKSIHTILVTSPQSSEGKTTIAVNLAAIISQTGKRVALVEADLRRPQIQNLLGLSDQSGLSEVLSENAEIQTIGWVQTALPNLTIITAGKLPSNPAELVGSVKMDQILRELQARADVVVIDSPPSFVADTQILASKVDAVLLVIQPELTHAEAARNTVEIFKRSKARIVGVVMNRIPRNRGYYDYNDKDYFAHVSASGAVPRNASTD